MATFIVMTGIFLILSIDSLLNLFAYAIDVRISRAVNRHVTTTSIRAIFSLFLTYLNFRFAGEYDEVESLPSQYLIISNHQSLLDIPLFSRYLDGPRLRFVAKAELGRNVPLISIMLKSDQHCLVDRSGSPSKAMKEIDLFAARVRENNWIPVIFPEGTRSLDGRLGTFHAAGMRRFLDKAPMPVAICALDGAWRISSIPGMAKNLKNGFYRVKVLKVFPAPSTKAEQVHILEEGKRLIQVQLDKWREETQ